MATPRRRVNLGRLAPRQAAVLLQIVAHVDEVGALPTRADLMSWIPTRSHLDQVLCALEGRQLLELTGSGFTVRTLLPEGRRVAAELAAEVAA
jgi:hypothetical protein